MNEQISSRILAALSTFLLGAVLFIGLFGTGEDFVQGPYVRLLFVHPSVAWVAYVAFSITTVTSLLWLWPKTRKTSWDQISGASAEIGVVFTTLALITGSIWGRPAWGTWWEWDPRMTSTLLLLFMYLGVLAVRRLPSSIETRARRSAIVAIIAFLDVPIVHFSVTLWRGLHQKASLIKPDSSVYGWQKVAMLLSFFGFTFLYFWLLIQRYRIARWDDRLQDNALGVAIRQRRAESEVDAGGNGASDQNPLLDAANAPNKPARETTVGATR
jgi:heme exporter protein C